MRVKKLFIRIFFLMCVPQGSRSFSLGGREEEEKSPPGKPPEKTFSADEFFPSPKKEDDGVQY